MKVELGKFLEVMGIPYKDIHLFKEAFTHPSYTNENKGKNYERLEFLGDSVLQYYVSKFIYDKFPEKPDGGWGRFRGNKRRLWYRICFKNIRYDNL